MKHLTQTILLILLSANFTHAFDMPKMPSLPSAPANLPQAPTANPEVEKKVNDFLKKNTEANQFMQKSMDSLFKIIAPKEKVAKIDAYMKKVEAMTDEKQKAAAIKKAQVAQNQVVNQVLADDKSMKAIGALNDTDKVALGKILYNLHLAVLLDKDIAKEGPEAIKAASGDPMMLKRVDEIKTALSETKEQMENGQKLIVGVSKLAGLNGVKVDLPKTSQDAAK